VHILHGGQEELSNRFALRSNIKFGDIGWRTGSLGSPLLPDYAACLECQTVESFPGGDHIILVGRVIKLDRKETAGPLLYFQGRYHRLLD